MKGRDAGGTRTGLAQFEWQRRSKKKSLVASIEADGAYLAKDLCRA
jgi:hypothetical protein